MKLIDKKPTEAGHDEPLPQINNNQGETAASSPGADILPDDKDEDNEDDLLDIGSKGGQTFKESMREKINVLQDFLGGLKYQVQFRDGCMLQALELQGQAYYG